MFWHIHLNSAKDLYLHELRDLYDAEHQLLEALPKMVEAASTPTLKRALSHHAQVTRQQVRRLETIFGGLGEAPDGEKCEAMKGLIEEGDEIIKAETNGNGSAVKDAALISAAQRVEHYEMAGYGSARDLARVLGFTDAAELLQTTLDEEGEADKELTHLAVSEINSRAAHYV